MTRRRGSGRDGGACRGDAGRGSILLMATEAPRRAFASSATFCSDRWVEGLSPPSALSCNRRAIAWPSGTSEFETADLSEQRLPSFPQFHGLQLFQLIQLGFERLRRFRSLFEVFAERPQHGLQNAKETLQARIRF